MKILFILPWIPYPLDSGGNQAFFNMLDAIRKTHEVSLVAYTHSSAERQAAKDLQAVWSNVKIDCYTDKLSSVVSSNITLSGLDKKKCEFYGSIERSMKRKRNRILRKYDINPGFINEATIEESSYKFTLGGFVRENSTLFRNTSDLNPGFLNYIYNKSREGFDMVQVEFYEYLPLVYVLPDNVRKVFVHHELRFVRNENEMSLFDNQTFMDDITLQKQKDAEIAMLARYNDVIVLTEVDKQILGSYLPTQNIYVSPALTSASGMADKLTFTSGKDIVFLGGGSHFPNADGILWFAMEVWPILKKLNFNGTLHIAGKWGDAIRNLIYEYCPEVVFAGFVEDLYGFINGKITIVPIRIGSGMRMKIIDAMAAHSPMVTTSKGCEGLPLIDGEDCFITDNAKEFAQRIIELANNTQLQQSMVEKTSKKITSILDAKTLLETRLNFYE